MINDRSIANRFFSFFPVFKWLSLSLFRSISTTKWHATSKSEQYSKFRRRKENRCRREKENVNKITRVYARISIERTKVNKKREKEKRKENRNVLHNSVAKKISWSWQSVSFRFYSFCCRSFFRLFSSWLSAHLQHYSCHSGLYYWLVQPKGISKIHFASLTKSQKWHENVKIIAWKALAAVMVLLLLFQWHTIWHCLFIVYLFEFGRFGEMLQ